MASRKDALFVRAAVDRAMLIQADIDVVDWVSPHVTQEVLNPARWLRMRLKDPVAVATRDPTFEINALLLLLAGLQNSAYESAHASGQHPSQRIAQEIDDESHGLAH